VTFLPLLNEPACFDLLVYADKQATVPVTWEDSDPCFIANSEHVKLRSFDTKVMLGLGCLACIFWCKFVLSLRTLSIFVFFFSDSQG